MAEWRKACTLGELEDGEPLGVKLDGVAIGLFKVGARCYAIHDVCSHEYALLSKGIQEGEIVECPLHLARFNVATGKCIGPPAERDVATFAVSIEGDDVLVALPPRDADSG